MKKTKKQWIEVFRQDINNAVKKIMTLDIEKDQDKIMSLHWLINDRFDKIYA
ncbi:MAG: hypothetical protein IJ733_03905 [Lachnospiraceae bacterium]|nr:hypothetical protein [Lachnospiraceae bacterium]